MQCPECNHIPLAGNQPDQSRCPECGIYYQKAIELRRSRDQQSQQQAANESGAKKQAANALSPAVRGAMAEYKGAQPVVVLDVSMSFGSMVIFMIKWALAAIPALLILGLIGFFVMAFIGVIGR
jgi:predicted  nucleic acid-binding Zn-ribbon protein